MLSDGRCAQDNFYLELISENDMPESILKRFEKKLGKKRKRTLLEKQTTSSIVY